MNEFDIWYSLVKLPHKIKLNILKKFNTTEKIWYYSISKKNFSYFQNFKIYKALGNAWDNEKINLYKDILLNDNIKITSYNDDDYPEKLKYFEDSPSVLYYKGDIKKLNYKYNVAIVGSRKCTHYGENVTELITKELSLNKINIISGMARGIDSIAHTTSLNKCCYTCAVLGSGIDVVYPKENRNIYDKIIENGCVISEFAPGTPPYAGNFPIRNRIISGLSDLIIVIEAGLKSGTLITANYALNQGKDVMAVPGTVFSEQSKGTNKLIKDGAYPFTNVEDIFQLLDIEKQGESEKSLSQDKRFFKVLGVLNDSPMHIDDIIKLTNIDIEHLYRLLFEMQLSYKIKCLAGNYYVKINEKF